MGKDSTKSSWAPEKGKFIDPAASLDGKFQIPPFPAQIPRLDTHSHILLQTNVETFPPKNPYSLPSVPKLEKTPGGEIPAWNIPIKTQPALTPDRKIALKQIFHPRKH